MKNDFRLSPDFTEKVMGQIKSDGFVFSEQKEIKQLWHFSLATMASAAALAFVLAISLNNTSQSTEQIMNSAFDDFDVALLNLTD